MNLTRAFRVFFAFHFLGLIQNQNRAVLADDINGPAGLKIVQFLVNTAVILACCVECLDIDDHDMDARTGRKTFQLMKLLGVVNKRSDFFSVDLGEVFGGDLKGLGDPFPNGDAGHHDNELGPSIPLVHFENGLDIAIGLSRAGFHFHVQVDFATGAGDQVLGQGQILAPLDVLNVFQQLQVSQLNVCVFKSRQIRDLLLGLDNLVFRPSRIDTISNTREVQLTGKTVHNRFHGLGLKGLDLEFQLHDGSSLNGPYFRGRGKLFENLFYIDFNGIGGKPGVPEHHPQGFDFSQFPDQIFVHAFVKTG